SRAAGIPAADTGDRGIAGAALHAARIDAVAAQQNRNRVPPLQEPQRVLAARVPGVRHGVALAERALSRVLLGIGTLRATGLPCPVARERPCDVRAERRSTVKRKIQPFKPRGDTSSPGTEPP